VLAYAEKRTGREAQIRAALKYWYSGEVAERIDAFCRNPAVAASARDGQLGLLTGADMAAWHVPIERPVWVDWNNYRIFKCGPWSQGPVLLQALQLLAPMNLRNLNPTEPEFVHLIVEALKLVMADRDAWYGDAGNTVPMQALLSTSYADERRRLIRDVASQCIEPGRPNGIVPTRVPLISSGSQAHLRSRGEGEPTLGRRQGYLADVPETAVLGDTCQVDAVDRWGNLVAATPSGGWLQSSPAIPGLGFALTTRAQMCWLTEGMNSTLAPGRRPRTTLTPTLVYRDGSPYLAYGTPGGDQQDQWSLLMLIYHLLHDMNLQEAIDMPAFHTEHLAASFWPRETALGSLTLEGRYPKGTVAELLRRGHHTVVGEPWSEGRLSACGIDTRERRRVVKAAANPRGMQGYAVGR
jgi:gamma-glutamyltranspeptidase/glutathione hydrolase